MQGYDPVAGAVVPLAAMIEHPQKDMVRITAAPGYSVTVLAVRGRPVEAIILADTDEGEVFKAVLSAPSPGQPVITITRPSEQIVEVTYGQRS